MAIKKHVLKSCCGGKSFVFELESAISKSHIAAFQKNGYTAPALYTKAGLFYVQKKGLTATSSFGSTKIQVKAGKRALAVLDDLEQLLDELTKK